ncbi:MAG: S-layer homology domain-containing protein, partial [Muribaculaceae bacterium]|nr:S-layer homology domain-containing protein [Muribaculaceae bacterium]
SYRLRHVGTDTREPGEPCQPLTILGYEVEAFTLSVDIRLLGGRMYAKDTEVAAGSTAVVWIKPDTGYEISEVTVRYYDWDANETVTLTPDKGALTADGWEYTFTMPASDVDVTAVLVPITYTITHNLTHISCDLGDEASHTATYRQPFSVTFTPDEGYELPRTLASNSNAVIETDTGRRFTAYTYEVDAQDPEARVMTFTNGVTCNITITGTATLKNYTVVYQLTNGLTVSSAPQTVRHGSDLSVTLSAARGYALPDEVSVSVNGADLAAGDFTYDAETGALTVPGVTGNVVVTAQGAAQSIALQAVVLVGPARVGRTLDVNTVPALATVEYQWFLVDEDGTETLIEGATGETYVIPPTAEGKTIKVTVTGTGSYSGTLTCEPTAVIQAADAPFVYVTDILLDPEDVTVAAGKSVTISATVTPDDATAPTLLWTSDNEAIATVDQNGKVTGVAEGTATITVASTDTALDQRVIKTCAVTVTAATGGNGGSAPSAPTTQPAVTTETTVNDDGSTTTTVTNNETGAVTETTVKPDGAKVEKVIDPEEGVSIVATDPKGETIVEIVIPAVIPEPETKFVDVPDQHWAAESINTIAALGVVEGVGNNRYDMTSDMTRGALTTVLHRLSSKPTGADVTFEDVADGKYYTEGVAWAAKVGVVEGFSAEEFRPELTITREQLALMLMRYAKLLGVDTSASADALNAFVDGANTHSWATDGVAWCVKAGILQGKDNDVLDPTANVTRAEVAVMIDRFIGLMK